MFIQVKRLQVLNYILSGDKWTRNDDFPSDFLKFPRIPQIPKAIFGKLNHLDVDWKGEPKKEEPNMNCQTTILEDK